MCDSADRRGGSLAFAYAQYQLKSKRPIPKNWPFVDILGSPNWVRTSDLRINSPSHRVALYMLCLSNQRVSVSMIRYTGASFRYAVDSWLTV